MTKILLSGANGKMGQAVQRAAAENPNVEIVAGFDLNTDSTHGYPVYSDLSQVREAPEVIIDFSHPSCLDSILTYATQKGIPAVICTTGLSAEQTAAMKKAAEHTAIFFSANMSLGVNLLIDLACRAAKILENNFDIEIIEKHHNQKVDAPSGTALAIADALSETVSYQPEYVYDRHSVRKKRDKKEIGLHAVRGGTIVGEHSIIFAGTDEVIELKHSAASKEVFAVGAVRAAIFMAGKKSGMYNMKDLIGE